MTAKIAKTPRAPRKAAVLAPVLPMKRTRPTKRATVAPAAMVVDLPPITRITNTQTAQPIVAQQPATPARTTRRDQIVTMLSCAKGASIAELMAATGWLPHTTRAALSGLRKAGMILERTSKDGTSRYRIKIAA